MSDAIHPRNPTQLVRSLQLFIDTLCLCHLVDHSIHSVGAAFQCFPSVIQASTAVSRTGLMKQGSTGWISSSPPGNVRRGQILFLRDMGGMCTAEGSSPVPETPPSSGPSLRFFHPPGCFLPGSFRPKLQKPSLVSSRAAGQAPPEGGGNYIPEM